MSFTVRLATDLAQVEAGATFPLSVEVSNRGDVADTYELQIEGLDPEWTAVPVPAFPVEAHDIQSERILLKPPRVTESLAGTYPFVVSVRSLESGELRSAQGVLEIKPFHHVSVDVTPKKGFISPVSKECNFDVTVMNLGNSEHTLQLFASDPEDECALDFEPDKVTIGPGQQRGVVMRASGKRRPLLANSRLHGISISARSVSAPTVAGNAQAQLEQKALVSPGAFIVGLVFLMIIAAWAIFLPKPPVLDVLTATPTEVMVGDTVSITWRASDNAGTVVLRVNDDPIGEFDRRGQYEFVAKQPGTLRIGAYARSGNRESAEKRAEVEVKSRPVIPLPEILSFKITPERASLGQKLMVSLETNDAVVKATIWPQGIPVDPKVGEVEIDATQVGTVTYTLVAENSEGKRAEATAKVVVERSSQAKIAVFNAEPTTLESAGGVTRLSWSVTNAAYVEILFVAPSGEKIKERVEASGQYDASIEKTTTFTLVAYDAEGLTSTKEVKVEVKPAPPPVEDEDPRTPPTTGGG